MKKLLSLLCAAAMVVSASAAPEFASRTSKRTAIEAAKSLPAVEYTAFNHTRLVSAPATGIKKAPAAVSNGKIVADYAQALFYPTSFTGSSYAMYAFDFFSGEDFAAYAVVKANSDSSKLVGNYSLLEGQVVVAAGDTTDITSGSLAITYAAPNYHFALNAVCANGQTYTMDLDYAAAKLPAVNYMLYYMLGDNYPQYWLIELNDAPFVPTGNTIDIVIPGISILTDNTGTDGYFEITGYNAPYYVVLDINSNQVAGTYGKADFDYKYSAIIDYSTDEGIEIALKEYDSNTATVSVKGDTTFVEASVMGKDGNIYHITMKYYIPTPTQTINVTLQGEMDPYTYADYGLIKFDAEDDSYMLSLILPSKAGTYAFSDITLMNSTSYSFFGDLKTGYIIEIVDASLTMTSTYAITGYFISTDARKFNLKFSLLGTDLDNTKADDAKAQKVLRNGQLVIIKNGVEYNALGTQL